MSSLIVRFVGGPWDERVVDLPDDATTVRITDWDVKIGGVERCARSVKQGYAFSALHTAPIGYYSRDRWTEKEGDEPLPMYWEGWDLSDALRFRREPHAEDAATIRELAAYMPHERDRETLNAMADRLAAPSRTPTDHD